MLIISSVKKTAVTLCTISDEVTHDQLTRALNTDGFWQTLLESITKPFRLRGGYLIIDDTVLEKPHGKEFEQASYVFSSTKGKAVFGYSIVLLIWTDGTRRIILGERIYKKGGATKIELALEMLSDARNRLKLKPEFVLFDSWYTSKKLLKRLKDYGWYFVTRLRKNRSLNGQKLSKYRLNPYWTEIGVLTGGIKVCVVKNANQYFATNRLSISRCEILKIYEMRQQIEEVNKALKHCSLADCQMRSIKAQANHLAMCVFAYTLIEQESRKIGLGFYKCRLLFISGKRQLPNSYLERLRLTA
jgi:putative transposase